LRNFVESRTLIHPLSKSESTFFNKKTQTKSTLEHQFICASWALLRLITAYFTFTSSCFGIAAVSLGSVTVSNPSTSEQANGMLKMPAIKFSTPIVMLISLKPYDSTFHQVNSTRR